MRLMSAVLAATDWPQRAHARKGHRPHSHARKTTKWLQDFQQHPAIVGAQQLLDKNAPLEAFYTYARKMTWPEMSIADPPPWAPNTWNVHIADLFETSNLEQLWKNEESYWTKSHEEAESILKNADFYTFLAPFVGQVSEQMVFMPNISYPSDTSVGVRFGGELISLGPPRIAWGDNPPWPFNEDPGHIYTVSLSQYARLLMLAYLRKHAQAVAPIAEKGLPVKDEYKVKYPQWGDQFTELFVSGVVAIYLEQNVNPQEAKAFVLMERKTKGMTILPGVISVLQRYLNEHSDGKYESFIDYLPHFPGHLRVAKSISAL